MDGEGLQPQVANMSEEAHLGEHDMVRRMGPNGAVLVLVQDMFGPCLVPSGPKLMNSCRPERHERAREKFENNFSS